MASRQELAAARRLQRIADAAEPAVRARVLRALLALQRGIRADRLERVLVAGDAFSLYDLASTLPAGLRPALRLLSAVYRNAAKATTLPGGIRVSFSMLDPFAIEAARTRTAELVTRVTQETRRAISAIVRRGFVQGIPPREMAALIRPLIGLTEGQARSVLRMQASLRSQGLTAREVAARTERYALRLLRQRAITIARTETIRAAAQGQLDTMREARFRGLLPQGVRKQWMVTPDDRLCDECSAMDGESVPLDSLFPGGVDAPPLHPRCRCAVVVDVQTIRTPQPQPRRAMRVGRAA